MRRTKDPDDLENNILPKEEFRIPQAKTKKCSKGVLKCCSIIALTLGLNAFSFYVGYRLASEDNSESL